MNVQRITVTNFLCHKFKAVDLPDGITGVVGTNGSGKSSLMVDSVTWALFGRSRISGGGDDLIRHGAKSCEVSIEFEVGGVEYCVTRKRANRKTELFFEKQESGKLAEDLSRTTVKLTQAHVEKTIGMSYEVFSNSCCVEQGSMNNFSLLSPSQASQVLYDILQLGRYVGYKDSATVKFMKADKESHELEKDMQQVSSDLENVDMYTKIEDKASTQIDSVKSQLENAQKKYDKSSEAKKTLETKHRKLEADLSKIKQSIRTIEADLDEKKSTLDGLKEECPLCRNSITKEKRDSMAQSILSEISTKSYKLVQAEILGEQVEGKMKKLYDALKTNKSVQLLKEVNSLENNLSQLESKVSTIAEVKDKVGMLDELKAKQKFIDKKISECDHAKTIYSELSNAFNFKGIPLHIIDSSLRELVVLINDNLALLCELPIYTDMVTQRESLSGNSIDTLKIRIMEGNSEKQYHNYSGGEKTIIDLSVRLGLSELLARRNNFKVETLIVDEGLGTLDDTNQQLFIETLIALTSKFRKIIVITHTQAKDYLKNVVKLEKSGVKSSTNVV